MTQESGPSTSLPDIRLRPERRSARVRAEILGATERLLASDQLHQISVEHISREAGVSRPTFYSYFASKLEIVLELYGLAAAETYTAVSPMWKRPATQSPADAVRMGIGNLVRAWVPHRAVFHAAIEHRYSAPEMMAKSQETIAYFVRNISAQLEADRSAGIAPRGAAAEPLVTTLVWSTEHALYIASRGLSPGLPDVQAAIEPLEAMWLGALYRDAPDSSTF